MKQSNFGAESRYVERSVEFAGLISRSRDLGYRVWVIWCFCASEAVKGKGKGVGTGYIPQAVSLCHVESIHLISIRSHISNAGRWVPNTSSIIFQSPPPDNQTSNTAITIFFHPSYTPTVPTHSSVFPVGTTTNDVNVVVSCSVTVVIGGPRWSQMGFCITSYQRQHHHKRRKVPRECNQVYKQNPAGYRDCTYTLIPIALKPTYTMVVLLVVRVAHLGAVDADAGFDVAAFGDVL